MRVMPTLLLKNIAMKHLALRITAKKIFAIKEICDAKSITLDFTGIESMSRSFAHEYIQCKKHQTCEIFLINVSEDIQKMFDIVKNSKARKEPVMNIKPVDLSP